MSDVGMLLNQTYSFEEKEVQAVEEFSQEKSSSGDKKLKVIKVIFLILCVLLIGELIAYRYVLPSFASPKVTIRGNKVYSAEEIASKFVPMHCSSWFDFDVEEGVSILSSDPGIDSAIIEKKFPNRIFVDVVERIPVAVMRRSVESAVIADRTSSGDTESNSAAASRSLSSGRQVWPLTAAL